MHAPAPGRRPTDLPALRLPPRYNYVAAFLTLGCNYRCSFCINRFGTAAGEHMPMSGAEWVRGLNRLALRPDLPVTLQGGEPSLHPDFYAIVRGLREDLPVDLLTNLQFDVDEFMAHVPPGRMRRQAPYASIRVSFHPEVMSLEAILPKVLKLLARGYSVGVWAVRHPAWLREVAQAEAACQAAGIAFRAKEFLGIHEGALHGTYRHPAALSGKAGPPVQCRTSELIVGPAGHVFRCHGDLYVGRPAIGHLCDPGFWVEDVFRPCDRYGLCNPCDVKLKTDRFQAFGHTSVEIRLDAV